MSCKNCCFRCAYYRSRYLMSVLYMVTLSLLAYVVLGEEEDDILKPINSVTPWFEQIIFEFCCTIWVGVIIYLNYLAATFAKERAKKIEERPLPDVLHDILPHIDRYTPDYLMFLSLVICIFRLLHKENMADIKTCDKGELLHPFPYRIFLFLLVLLPFFLVYGVRGRKRCVINYGTLLCEFLVCIWIWDNSLDILWSELSSLWTVFPIEGKYTDVVTLLCCLTLRPIFICVTTFPSCVEMTDSKSMYSKLFLSTHDLMFSGHTCIFTFCGFVIGGPMGFVIKFLFPISLIAARQHYTIDVIVAMFIYRFCALMLAQSTSSILGPSSSSSGRS